MQVLARLSSSGHNNLSADLKQLFPELAGGQGDYPLINLLCRECANVNSPALAEAVLRLCLAQTLRDAAQRPNADVLAAAWRVLSLARKAGIAGGQNHGHATAQILTSAISSEVMGSPPVLCMVVAALSDIGQAGSAGAARDRALEAARSQGHEAFPEVANYYKLFAEKLRAATGRSHICTFLSDGKLALRSAFCLHCSSDSLALEAIHSTLPENSKTLSGPPLMISTQLKINWPRKKMQPRSHSN
jgi:hypothetical protein